MQVLEYFMNVNNSVINININKLSTYEAISQVKNRVTGKLNAKPYSKIS